MISNHLPIIVILLYFLGALLMPLAGMISKRLPWAVAFGTNLLALGLGVAALVRTLEDGPSAIRGGGLGPAHRN
jgi:hypothetical protein